MWWANCIGVTGAPFDSYLTLRGLRTLHARLRVHGENARASSRICSRGIRRLRHVYYPGLRVTSAARAGAQRSRPASARMLSFELHGGIRQVRAFLDGLQLLLARRIARRCREPGRASGEHDARGDGCGGAARAGISDTLLRLSIGIEAADDLLRDLHGGLERAAAVHQRRVQAEPQARRLEFC